MSPENFKHLIELCFPENEEKLFNVPADELYRQFEAEEDNFQRLKMKTAPDQLVFLFEQIRLGVAAALVSAFNQLSEHEESEQTLQLLRKALKANSISEIDAVMHEGMEAFENLFIELFDDQEREQILIFLEDTLQASTKKELDLVITDSIQFLERKELE